jgi:serine/threonine protein kinase
MGDRVHRNSLKPGYKLHWYRIDKILGQGGFGITYLAYNFNLDRMAAIKEYLPIELAVREGDFSVQPLTDEHGKQFHWGLERFLSEAKTLARFEHPNIVRVLDVFEANHTAYMVMSYEEGESLQEVLTRRKTMEEEELMDILIPIMGGLEKVHAAGFIHRDIKPANIFLRTDGSPVLLDFGSARQALGVQTKTLTSLVSPGYAPFEQYYSKSDAQGPWSDIYGLGATMYRGIAGVPPQDAVDRSRVILQGGRDTFVPALEIGRGLYSERFLRAIDHALQFREKDRPQTISAWKQEFSAAGQPVPAAKSRSPMSPEKLATERAQTIVPARPQTKVMPRAPSSEPSRWSVFRPVNVTLVALLLVAAAGVTWIYRGKLDDLVIPAKPYNQGQPEQEIARADAARTRESEQERRVKIQSLLTAAQADFEALRLTQPESDNALQGYRKILELDPQNAEAKQGLSNIADKLVTLAQHATAANDFTQAESYLNEAASIVPDAPNIQLARNELNLKKTAQERANAEAKARQEKAQAALKEAAAAADKGDALTALTKLEQARTLGADAAAIATVRDHLHTRLETLAAAATEEAQQALKAKDTIKARAALKRARDLKTQVDALATQ